MPHCLLCQVSVHTKDKDRAFRLIALWISACPWFTFLADYKAENGIDDSDAYFVDLEKSSLLANQETILPPTLISITS